MKRFLTLFETVLVILVLAFTVYPVLGFNQPGQQDGNEINGGNQTAFPEIQFDELNVDIGKVNQHKTVAHQFTFKNIGTGTLTIQKVKAG